MKLIKALAAKAPLKVEKVEYRDITVADLITAERITGKTEGWAFSAAVASQVATFDGQNLPPEEIERLAKNDFLVLLGALDMDAPETSPGE